MSDLFETFGFDLQRFVNWTFDQATVGTATETTARASGKYFWNGSDFEGEGISSATFTGTVSAIALSSAVGGGTAYNILSVSSISDLVPDEGGTVTITDAGGATLASTAAEGTFVFDKGTFKVAGDSEVTFSLSSTNVTGISGLLGGSVEGTLNGITINNSATSIAIEGDTDGLFTYTVDTNGKAILGGVGGSNVTVSGIAGATVVKTDEAGEYTFLGETFNTSDSALTVSLLSQSSVEVTDLDEGKYITSSFSVVASVNGVSFDVQGDSSFAVYGGASAAGISMIAEISDGAIINNAGSAAIVQTDEVGTFTFASGGSFVVEDDSSIQFIMDGNSVSGISALASGSVSGLLNGLYINNSSTSIAIDGDTDGLFTYKVDADGKATLSGVGGSNVTVSGIAGATVVQTSESGTYTFLGETFNTSDSALTVSLLSTSSIAITDLDAGEYIEGSFSSVASINGETFKVSGDSAFGVVGADSGIGMIYDLNDGATVSSAGGASVALTIEDGTFTFGSQSFVVAGDSDGVTFLLDSDGAVVGVSGLDEGATLSGDLNALTSINGTSFNVDNDTDLAVVGGASAIGIKSIQKLSNGADVVHAGGAMSAITDEAGTFIFSTGGQSFIVYGDSSVDFVMDGDKVVGITGLSGAVETSGALFAGGFSVNGKTIDITGDDGTIIVESEDGDDVDNIIGVGAADNGTVTITDTGDADWLFTDKTGTFNFAASGAGQVFTTDDDNLGFYMDENAVVAVESLNGGKYIEADSEVLAGTSGIAVNGKYVQISGDDNDIRLYGNDGLSSISMIDKVGGSDGVTVTSAAGASIVQTDADGKFYFATGGQSFATNVTEEDNSMQFILSASGIVTGVDAFSDGTLALNAKQTPNLDVNLSAYPAQSLSFGSANDVTLTIDPYQVVGVAGLSTGDSVEGLIGSGSGTTVIAQNGELTVNGKTVSVTEGEDADGKYNIIVTGGSANTNGTVTKIDQVQGPATVEAASVAVRVNKDASTDDFVIGGESYTMDDSQDVNSGFTFDTDKNNALTAVYSLEGAITFNDGTWSGTVNNDTVAVYNPGSRPARVSTDGSDITAVDGLSSGAIVNAPEDVQVAMPGTSSTEDPTELTVNGTTYQLLNDEDGIEVTGSGVVTGLDPYATLIPSEAGTYTVNGASIKAAQGDVLIGNPNGDGAYTYDADHILIRKATTKPEIQNMVGLSEDTTPGDYYDYESLEEYKALAASGLADLDQPLVFTLYNDNAAATQDFDMSPYRYTKKVSLQGGDQAIAFNDEGHNYAIVGNAGSGSGDKLITLGDGGDVVLMDMDSRSSSVNIIGGKGADSVFVRYAAPTTVDMSAGGKDMIVTEAEANARITLEGYDYTTGAGIMVEEFPIPISAAIDKDVINFGDGVVSITTDEGNSEIFVDDGTADGGTLVNLYTYKGEKQAVGFTGPNGGAIDASSATDPLILLGNDGNKKTGGSTLTGGKGNDTIYAGTDDVIDGGAGNNIVKLYNDDERGGAEVILSAGRTTVEGMNNTLAASSGDTLTFSVGKSKKIAFDGENLIISGDGFYGGISGVAVIGASAATSVEGVYDLTPSDYTTQFIKNTDNGVTYKAAIGKAGSVMEVTMDEDVRPNAYLGENSGMTFENFTEDALIDLEGDWESSTIDGNDVFITGVNSLQAGEGDTTFKGSDANETLIAGKGNTSIYGDGGSNLLVGFDDTYDIKEGQTTFFVLGVNDGAANTIRDFDFATDDNYKDTAKVTADVIEIDTENNVITRADISGDDVLIEVSSKVGNDTEKAVIEGAAGKDMIVSGVVAQVAEDVLVFERSDFYLATGKNATVSVSGSLDSHVNLWLDDTDTGKNFEGDIKVIDATASDADAELAGNDNDNEIYAGNGNTSLWGGAGGDDILVGGAGKDSFYYNMGNGNDTITAGDGDLIIFTDITLDDLSVESISSGAIEFSTSDGGRLTVNDGGNDVGFKVGDQTYYINSGRDEFYQK